MGIENKDKIGLLDLKISNLNVHIDTLSNDISINPEADVEGKPTRQHVLNEFQSIKEALLAEKQALTNLG
jgi:hypothetical protein